MSDDKKTPAIIAAFNCHGADLQEPQGGSSDWSGSCLFCGKENHFFASAETGKWDCKVCGSSGNLITYLTKVVDYWHKQTTKEQWARLAAHRKIPAGVFKARKLAYDGSQWLIPSHAPSGYIHDIRRYNWQQTMSTAGCKSQLFGMERLAKAKPGTKVWLCEGEWDALAMDWVMREMSNTSDVVVAVPGAGTLKTEWLDFFQGKHVVAIYDADKAGDDGAMKAYRGLKSRAKKLEFVNWPESRPKGYDLRDFVTVSMAETTPETTLKSIDGLKSDKPRSMRAKEQADEAAATKEPKPQVDPISFEELVKVFEKQVMTSPDFIDGLRIACSVALSNDIPGDPLWMYIVGPPGAGKTLILSSFSGSERCLFQSTVTPHSLVSGWRGDGVNDPSLIPKLKGLTFVAKDFTEILTMPPPIQEEIFSTLRGAYDGSVSKPFGNGVVRKYEDCYFSILAGVTHAIHGHKRATLGERFLKFQFKPSSKEQTNDVLMTAINNVGRERQIEDALKQGMQRYLAHKIPLDDHPLMTEEYSIRLLSLVQLIAALRAQVERDQRTQEIAYRPTQEYGTRLAKQLAKFAMSIAFTYGKKVVDDEVWRHVERVAYDTAYGFNFDIINAIMELNNNATRAEVSAHIRIPASTLSRRFEDMFLMSMVEIHPTATRKPGPRGGSEPAVYKVADNMAELWIKSKGSSWKPLSQSQTLNPASHSSTKRFVLRRRVTSVAAKA